MAPFTTDSLLAASDYSLQQKPSINPIKISLIFAIGYFVISSAYIWFSSLIAANVSSSIPDLQRIETIKGIAFMFITTISIFLVLFIMFKRLSKGEKKIIDQQQELIRSQREAIAGIFASSVAHDINNILIILDYYSDLLSGTDYSKTNYPVAPTDSAWRETGEKVHYAISELKSLAKRLMNIGKGNLPHEFSEFDLPHLIKETLELIRKHQLVQRCSLEYSGIKELRIDGNESIIRQLLINLILNAAQAIKGKGEIELIVNRLDQNAVIEVHDSGEGVPEEERDRIFEAFYSTRQGGTGLGLLSVKVYTEIHKGQVTISDSHLGGACFRVQIPLNGNKSLNA